jgi:tripartite-type tricarboxylate transporter receptor subunit TctC
MNTMARLATQQPVDHDAVRRDVPWTTAPNSTLEPLQARSGIATCILGIVLLVAPGIGAQAQTSYPTRPITLVVPYPAGGPADLLCRFAGEKASGTLGQQVVIENRPGGAGGRIGIEQVLRAAPDGYTLLCATQLNYSISHLVFTKSALDARKLEPVSVLASYPLIILLRQNFPANDLKEFIDYARANPGKVNYGHAGKGNTGQLLAELMMMKANFRMTEVPYRGSAPSINDLLAGNIDMVPDYLLANKGNIDAGKLKFIAVASEQRLKDYPKVPTVSETLPGVTSITWMAVSAPPGTPKEIARRVSDAIGQGFRQPDLRARILALEAEPLGSTPDEMRDMIHKSLATWGPVVEAAKISFD